MRVFAVSDLHIDYEVNGRWIAALSALDYRDDILVLAGDVSDTRKLLGWCLAELAKRFRRVLFVPGNHDLWVLREGRGQDSLQKLEDVRTTVIAAGASMEPVLEGGVEIVPLLSWYDYSFGEPSGELRSVWMDYHACRWPAGTMEKDVAAKFASLNEKHPRRGGDTVITFSHFLPRVDLMPVFIPGRGRLLYPVLGVAGLDEQVRERGARIHVYGHSHVRRQVTIDGVSYVNNAFGYPGEWWVSSKTLKCIHEC